MAPFDSAEYSLAHGGPADWGVFEALKFNLTWRRLDAPPMDVLILAEAWKISHLVYRPRSHLAKS